MKPYTSDSNSLQYYSYIIKEQMIKFSGSRCLETDQTFLVVRCLETNQNFLVVRCLEKFMGVKWYGTNQICLVEWNQLASKTLMKTYVRVIDI